MPDAEFTILKIGDRNPISEWHVLSALIAAHEEDVVNMSLSFGLGTSDCRTCGRHQTSSSRSAAFEQGIDEQLRLRSDCVLVAAAGNRNWSPVDFPARFGEVVAVGAVDSSGAVSGFASGGGSNYGTAAHGGVAHDRVFFDPAAADRNTLQLRRSAARRNPTKGRPSPPLMPPLCSRTISAIRRKPTAGRRRSTTSSTTPSPVQSSTTAASTTDTASSTCAESTRHVRNSLARGVMGLVGS